MPELAKQETPMEVAGAERIRQGVTYTPCCDIVETENELILLADLPGVKPEDLDIQFENGELILQGKATHRHADREFLFGEYGIGDFQRAFTIGETIDTEKISAELKNGVVTIHLPKSEALKPRRIEVKAS